MKEGRKQEYPKKNKQTNKQTMTTSFRKCHILKPKNSSPNRDSNPHSSIGDRLGMLTIAPRVALNTYSHTLRTQSLHTSTHAFTHTHACTHTYLHTHTHTHTLSLSLSHTHTHTHTNTQPHTHTHIHTHTYTHTYSHTHTHTHLHTHTHIHTQTHIKFALINICVYMYAPAQGCVPQTANHKHT